MLEKIKSLSITLFGVFMLTMSLSAEWESISFKEHVEKASLIVIAEFKEEIEKKKIEIGTEQLVSFEVNESIKGEVNGSLTVRGQKLYMCMPQMLFPNTPTTKYLLFLEQDENRSIYNLVHGERSALVVKNASVGWITDREKIDKGEPVSTSLDEVKKEIGDVIDMK